MSDVYKRQLSASAATDHNAQVALEQLPKLKGREVHTSVLLSDVDTKIFKKLGVKMCIRDRFLTSGGI